MVTRCWVTMLPGDKHGHAEARDHATPPKTDAVCYSGIAIRIGAEETGDPLRGT
jgi:hypothetical protein